MERFQIPIKNNTNVNQILIMAWLNSKPQITLKKSNLPYVVLRLYQVYGPFQKKNRVISNVVDSLIKEKLLKVQMENKLETLCM